MNWPNPITGRAADTVQAVASTVTVDRNDHAAAAAYLMRHYSATALRILDGARSDRPVGIITEADLIQAEADGRDLNQVRVQELMSQNDPSRPGCGGVESGLACWRVNAMRSSAGRRTDGWLARAARRLGFDRNPLRRSTDRVEAILRLILVILLVTAVPAAAVAAGRQADHAARHRAQVQRSADHLVAAVLLRNAPATRSPDPYTSFPGSPVRARWQLPGQPPRTGVVYVTADAPEGSTVHIWTGPAGAITDPPPSDQEIVGDVCVAVMATCLVSWLVLLAAWTLARHVLDRRRLSAWEAGWRANGPLWGGRRP